MVTGPPALIGPSASGSDAKGHRGRNGCPHVPLCSNQAMTKPEQPAIGRSGRGEVVQDATKTRHGEPTDESRDTRPVPEATQRAHPPDLAQDQPTEVPQAYKAPD